MNAGSCQIIRVISDSIHATSFANIDQAIDEFGDWEVDVSENYFDAIAAGRAPGSRKIHLSLDEYFRAPSLPLNVGVRAMITESPVPSRLLERLSLPAFINPTSKIQMFAGRKGCASDLHCDWHPYHIFHCVLWGKKDLAVFPPEIAFNFTPVRNFAMTGPTQLRGKSCKDFVAKMGGEFIQLSGSDGVIIPPFKWHHFNYITDSISLSIRYGSPPEWLLKAFETQSRSWSAHLGLARLASTRT